MSMTGPIRQKQRPGCPAPAGTTPGSFTAAGPNTDADLPPLADTTPVLPRTPSRDDSTWFVTATETRADRVHGWPRTRALPRRTGGTRDLSFYGDPTTVNILRQEMEDDDWEHIGVHEWQEQADHWSAWHARTDEYADSVRAEYGSDHQSVNASAVSVGDTIWSRELGRPVIVNGVIRHHQKVLLGVNGAAGAQYERNQPVTVLRRG